MSAANSLPASIRQYVGPQPPADPVFRLAQVIAMEMEAIPGGYWVVRVDHQTGYVTIRQQRGETERSQP